MDVGRTILSAARKRGLRLLYLTACCSSVAAVAVAAPTGLLGTSVTGPVGAGPLAPAVGGPVGKQPTGPVMGPVGAGDSGGLGPVLGPLGPSGPLGKGPT